TATSNVVTCTSSTAIASGGTSVFGFPVNVLSGATGTLVNKSQVGGGGDSTNPSAPTATTVGQCSAGTPPEGCATDTEQVDQVVDLVLQMNGTPVVLTGGTVVYTVRITNMGPSDGDGSTFAGVLPASLTGLTGSCGGANAGAVCPGSVTLTGNNFSGSIPTLPPGGSVILTFVGTAPNTPGVISGTSTVTKPAGATEPITTNNNGAVTTEVINQNPPAIANLSVTKAGTSVVQSSGSIQWQVVVTNAGQGAANGAVFTDTVPAAVTSVTWTCTAVGGAVCPAASGSGNAISQTIATLPAAGQLIYTINGTAPSTTQTLTNTATITPPAGVTDPETSDNTASALTVVQSTAPTTADLIISKIGPANVAPNASFTYRIVVRNAGPAAANGATVSDNLPDVLTGASVVCAASGGAACGTQTIGAGNLLAATITTLPKDGEVTYTVTATAPATGYFSNSAVVTPPTGVNDPDPLDNTGGPVITSVDLQIADIVLQKNGTPVVQTGGTIYYSLTISNAGHDPANGTTFSDTLPAGLTGVTATCGNANAGAVCPGSVTVGSGTVSGTIPTLPVGGSVVITITATAPATAGNLTNTAVVNPPTGVNDFNTSNNNGQAVTVVISQPVPAQANLSVIKAGTTTVQTGGTINWQFRVINAGPGAATGATISDPLPAGVTGTTWTCTAAAGAVCPAASGSGNVTQTVEAFPAGGQLLYNLTGTAPGSATTLTNTVTVAPPGGVTDPDLSDNTSPHNTTVQTTAPTNADLVVTKVGPANAEPNGQITYEIVVTNDGPASADGAELSDSLPASLSNIQVTCSAQAGAACGTNTLTGNLLTATITTLPAGGLLKYTVVATAPPQGYFTNSVTVDPPPGVTAPDPKDNRGGPVVTTVYPIIDLRVQKNATPLVLTGGVVVYTVQITNIGPSNADGATFTDTLPAGLSSVTATCGGTTAGAVCPGSLTVASGSVSGSIPTLPAGASVVISITGTAPGSAQTLTNSVVVAASPATIEVDTNDNTSSAKTEVVTQSPPPIANLAVIKAGTSLVKTGEQIGYQIRVVNAGPGAAN
ncbi:MAG: beta strand repeat-containing protein, partial [Acidobacteriota bacterium]